MKFVCSRYRVEKWREPDPPVRRVWRVRSVECGHVVRSFRTWRAAIEFAVNVAMRRAGG